MQDLHTHSQYSCDIPLGEGSSVRELCLEALEKGMSAIAITDHFDIDGVRDGFFPPLDHDSVAKDIWDAKDEFRGRLKVLHGVELGQATHMPKESAELLAKYPYDVVLASCHGVRGIVDFHDTVYTNMPKNEYVALWELYLTEMLDTIKWGNFEILTHITYPKRYFLRDGISDFPDIKNKGREYFEPILKAVIQSGKSLECNTSGLRQPMAECLPNEDLFRFYYELGGRDITIGSDAHNARDVGAGFKEAKAMLSSVGFKYTSVFNERKKDFILLEE